MGLALTSWRSPGGFAHRVLGVSGVGLACRTGLLLGSGASVSAEYVCLLLPVGLLRVCLCLSIPAGHLLRVVCCGLAV